MQSTNKKYELDMCNGPLLGKIFIYAFPLILSGVLQLAFNAADIIVVGQFAGKTALAAVGSNGALINLIINVFIGLSVGANVVTAHFYGAKKYNELSGVVHTSITAALISGLILVILGLILAEPALRLMGTPEDVIQLSALYLRIYFLGMPAMMLYNFGSSILRAIGDTKRPLYYLLIAGLINVVMNLIFVIVFHMSVAGVALATIISQAVSAVLVLRCLIKTEGYLHLNLKKLRIDMPILISIVKIGLPAGLQGTLFAIANTMIQSSINSFGSVIMAGNTAATNIEGFVYTAMNALYQTAISFTGQNHGAMKFKRIGRIALLCLCIAGIIGFIAGNGAYLFGPVLLKLYSDDSEVIHYGLVRMRITTTTYFLCGLMETAVGLMRGMGHSILPMIVSLSGSCLFRIVWIITVFEKYQTIESLYISYPISWLLTFLIHFICFQYFYRKLLKNRS